MIYIDRNNVEIPSFFFSEEHQSRVSDLNAFYLTSLKERAQKRFEEYGVPPEITDTLYYLFNGKCAYCESKIKLNYSTGITKKSSKTITPNNFYINYFRPQNNARGFKKEQINLDHYWWLSYEWNNFYLSCLECSKSKSSWFPVEGKRAKLLTPYKAIIEQEINLILDPCQDNVESHLNYEFKTGNIIPISKKGETSIEILNLNRTPLTTGRMKVLKDELIGWEYVVQNFKKSKKVINDNTIAHWKELIESTSKVEFVGIRRALLLDLLNNNLDIKKQVAILINFNENVLLEANGINLNPNIKKHEKISIKPVENLKKKASYANTDLKIRELLKNVYIEKIELKNFKCFSTLTINLSKRVITSKDEPWLVFLGENGVGKSSLIKAVALALMGQNYLDTLNLDASKILKFRTTSGYIRIHGSKKGELFEVTFNKKSKFLTSNIKVPPCYLLGYGSTRLLPKGNLKPEININYIKTKNLFDYSVSLSDAKSWLIKSPLKMFNQVAKSLKDLLLLDQDDVIKRYKNKLYIGYSKSKNRIDVEELSDGYKSIFAITVDIIQTLSKNNLAFETAEAIVLIDELGTHLHPRWKMEVVNRLRKAFPKIQFIVTTHEPLCLRGLQENEVSVLKKNEDGKIISITDLPNPSDFRVDQLLTSEYFGLNSTLDSKTEEDFKEYYNLLAKENRTIDEENRVKALNEELPNKKHLGDDIRDELAYFVIDELLAKQVRDNGYKIIDKDLKLEALKRVKNIWEFMDKNEN